MNEERVPLTPEQLDAMMPEGEYVHTFMNAGANVLVGTDIRRSEILEMAKERAELSGKQATAMKHGAVVWHENSPVFIETKSQ